MGERQLMSDSAIPTRVLGGEKSETMACFRAELPRVYELKDCISDQESSDAFFQDFEETLADFDDKRDAFLRLERVLQELDTSGWEDLKRKAVPRLTQRHKLRGWEQLFSALKEAWAFKYLRSIGCTAIRFIPESATQTPDLEGELGSDRVLCEVKTINPSDEEIAVRSGPPTVRSLPMPLAPRFFNKLSKTVEAAKQQMLAFDPHGTSIHIAYVNVSFDDFFAQCKEACFQEIDEYLAQAPVSGIQFVICNDYTVFYKPLQMRNAIVDNCG
jgi:hypothetical protein